MGTGVGAGAGAGARAGALAVGVLVTPGVVVGLGGMALEPSGLVPTLLWCFEDGVAEKSASRVSSERSRRPAKSVAAGLASSFSLPSWERSVKSTWEESTASLMISLAS